MVKQLFKSLLVVAAVMVTTSVFYSCKDYEDEIYAGMNQNREEMLDNVATLQGYIDALEQELATQVERLEQAQQACKDECAAARQQLQNAIDALQTAHDSDKAALQGQITEALQRIANLESADIILGEKIDQVKNDLAQVKSDLEKEIDENTTAIKRDSILIEQNKTAIAALQTLTSDYATVKQTAADAKELAEANGLEIKDLQDAIAGLESIIGDASALDGTLVSNILGALNNASSAMEKAKNNEVAIETLIKTYDETIERLESIDALIVKDLIKIKKQVAENKEAIEALADDIVAAQAAAVELSNAYTDKVVSELMEQHEEDVENIEIAIEDLREASEKADNELQEQIDALEPTVEKISETVILIESNVDDILDALNKQVTSVIAQATVNNVFGSFALPGLQPNILAAYYGQVVNKANFPCIESTTGLLSQDLNDAISQDVADVLGLTSETFDAGQTLFDGNAGTLYMTVNPNTVDFTGKTVTLVNSLDSESPVTLSPLKPSDYKISFGFTRATANGFYEAEATIEESELDNAKIRFELDGIKDVVKDVMTLNNGVNLTKVASTIMEQLSEFADANAIKATWTDSLGTHSVYSQYNVAAFAVKPLAFSFMKDVEISSIPGLDRIENALNNLMDKIEINIPTISTNIAFPQIQKIELLDINDLDEAKMVIELKKEITVEGQTITIKKEDVTFGGMEMDKDIVVTTKDETVVVEVTKSIKDIFVDVYGDVNTSLENVNEMLSDLEATFDDINAMLEDLEEINKIGDQITDFTESIKKELNNYLDKINNAAVNAVKSINGYIQPTLLVKTDGSFVQLSKSKYAPTKVNAANIDLLPTTKTAEMIAPAYKKYVAVTAGPADLANANSGEGLNTVYSGPRTIVNVNLAEAGTVYELTYAAMDYAGNVVQNKYYVQLVN